MDMKSKKRRTDDSNHEINLADLEDNQSSDNSENELKVGDVKEEEEDGVEDGWNSDRASDLDMVYCVLFYWISFTCVNLLHGIYRVLVFCFTWQVTSLSK